MTGMDRVIETLLGSAEPSVRWKVRTRVLDEPADSPEILGLRAEIRTSGLVRRLLAGGDPDGRLRTPGGVYRKWQGAHWVLATLADLGYPAGDQRLQPLREQVLDTWLGKQFYQEFEADSKPASYRRRGVPVMRGRYRRCASQQGNALWYLTVLGLADRRTDDLAELLLRWQWPDGGWNCDRNPDAHTSSFFESLLPMRGLAAYAAATGDATYRAAAYRAAADRAAEVFLGRHLLYRRGTRELIHAEFAQLHYPLYWHYDVLGGLKAMAELDLLGDDRCAPALDLLESLRLADGWPAQRRYYTASTHPGPHRDHVDWGGVAARRANEWVSADALAVLHAAGRT
jgi:hypothetical protein